jgi:hypothetical protein
MELQISLIKTLNSKGSKIEPCGTPDSLVYEWEETPQKLKLRLACGQDSF